MLTERHASPMKLHEAMQAVLRQAGIPLTTRQIADEIERRGLYFRGDGQPPPPKQVNARFNNYRHLFYRSPDGRIGSLGDGGT